MMRKTLTTATLGCVVAVAAGCANTTAFDRGIAHYNDGLYLLAHDDFTDAIRQDPRLPAAYVDRGVARVRLGDLNGAIDDYNRALAVEPNDPAIYFNRGNALVAAGMYELAVDDFTRTIERAPGFAKAWFNRGSALALAGRRQDAMKDWLHAIAIENDPWARAAMRRSGGLEPGTALASAGSHTTATTVAPPPPAGMAPAAVPLPPPATLAVTPPVNPAASPASAEGIDARALAMRAMSHEVDGDHEGALRDLRAAIAAETDPGRRASLEELLRKLEGPR